MHDQALKFELEVSIHLSHLFMNLNASNITILVNDTFEAYPRSWIILRIFPESLLMNQQFFYV